MQRFFFPRSKSQSHRRSSSQNQTVISNTRNMSSGVGHGHGYGQQNCARSSSRRHSLSSSPSYVPFNDFLRVLKQSSPFLTMDLVDSPTGLLPQSGSRPGPIPFDTSVQMTIIDDTVTNDRALFYVVTCSLDDLERVLYAICPPSDKIIKFSTIGIPSMPLSSTEALDNFLRHGYSVTLEIGWKHLY